MTSTSSKQVFHQGEILVSNSFVERISRIALGYGSVKHEFNTQAWVSLYDIIAFIELCVYYDNMVTLPLPKGICYGSLAQDRDETVKSHFYKTLVAEGLIRIEDPRLSEFLRDDGNTLSDNFLAVDDYAHDGRDAEWYHRLISEGRFRRWPHEYIPELLTLIAKYQRNSMAEVGNWYKHKPLDYHWDSRPYGGIAASAFYGSVPVYILRTLLYLHIESRAPNLTYFPEFGRHAIVRSLRSTIYQSIIREISGESFLARLTHLKLPSPVDPIILPAASSYVLASESWGQVLAKIMELRGKFASVRQQLNSLVGLEDDEQARTIADLKRDAIAILRGAFDSRIRMWWRLFAIRGLRCHFSTVPKTPESGRRSFKALLNSVARLLTRERRPHNQQTEMAASEPDLSAAFIVRPFLELESIARTSQWRRRAPLFRSWTAEKLSSREYDLLREEMNAFETEWTSRLPASQEISGARKSELAGSPGADKSKNALAKLLDLFRGATSLTPQALWRAGYPLSMEEYDNILQILGNMSRVLEKSPKPFRSLCEDGIRAHFLIHLNGRYRGEATAETFNSHGKTDILIQNEGRPIFVAECKFWNGPKGFLAAIDQLGRYLTWRDTKSALLIFNRKVAFSTVLKSIQTSLPSHSAFKRWGRPKSESEFECILSSLSDKRREHILTVLVFDIRSG